MGVSKSTLRIQQLERELETLKQDNIDLRKELELKLRQQLHQRAQRSPGAREPSEISSVCVAQFVDQILADRKTNMGYVANLIERPLEIKMMTQLLNSLGHLVDTATIQLMGHELRLRLEPLLEHQQQQQQRNRREPNLDEAGAIGEGYSSYDDEAYGNPSPVLTNRATTL
jgi:hypothetical protein